MGRIYKQRWKGKDGTIHESRVWWIKYYRDGKPMRESSESSKESDAKKLLKLREGDVAKGIPVTPKYSRITIDELLTDLETEYRVNGRDTLDDLEGRLRLHIRLFFGRPAGRCNHDSACSRVHFTTPECGRLQWRDQPRIVSD
jgi:hypothetical protein